MSINAIENSIGVVDLFCGIGGLTYGLSKAGLEVVAGYDLDPSCRFAYSQNNNSEFIEKSVEEITGIEIRKKLEKYKTKVIVGCAPCQPFSRHQKDKRHRSRHKDWKLLYEFGRIVEEAEPDVVSMENVPELEKEKVFKDFISKLQSLGYYVYYKIVDAADYGVAQRRKRLLLLASKKGTIELIEKTHNIPVTVRDVIGTLPLVGAGEECKTDRLHRTSALSNKNLMRIKESKPGGTWRDWPIELRLECHKKETGKSYGSVYGRMEWDSVSPTITTQFTSYGTGRFGHPVQNRALTIREGAMLQSFPKDYRFIANDEPFVIKNLSRHIGNAVPPRLGEIIGESIKKSVSR